MNKQFYSNCYKGDAVLFMCFIEGRDSSEHYLRAEIEGLGGYEVLEDTYEFDDSYRKVHDSLIQLGYTYMGPADDDALDTSK